MKRLVPALLALLAGCGGPTIPEQLGLEVGQKITVVYPATYSPSGEFGSARAMRYGSSPVQQISGDWARIEVRGSTVWLNLRLAVSIEQK